MAFIWGFIALIIIGSILNVKNYKTNRNTGYQTSPQKPRDIPANWRKYKQDPDQDQCSCPDWKKVRKQFPLGDPRRLCKHLCAYFIETKIPARHHLYIEALNWANDHGKGINPHSKIEWTRYGTNKILIIYPTKQETDLEESQQWVSIHYKNERHGFNAATSTWAHTTRQSMPPELIYQLERKICTKLDLPAPLLETIGTITTISRKTINNKGHVTVIGTSPDKTEISATLKPKGFVVNFEIAGYRGTINTKTAGKTVPIEYFKSTDDICEWITQELSDLKQERDKR